MKTLNRAAISTNNSSKASRHQGIGDYFLDSLFSDVDALLIHAGVHEQHLGYYRALSKRFPFAIYYRLTADEIQVWRILDCRINPMKIQRALAQ